jgi:hypothetical protein
MFWVAECHCFSKKLGDAGDLGGGHDFLSCFSEDFSEDFANLAVLSPCAGVASQGKSRKSDLVPQYMGGITQQTDQKSVPM